MTRLTSKAPPKRVLLTGVFGPYGIDDRYGRKENMMELFHNQVTRAQGAKSFRFHHRSHGLYFIAANIHADVTILDFPSRARFIRELKNGYDAIGISFITPNFMKAQEMARLARIHGGGAEIIMGGHGTAIEGIEELIDCDHVVRGEGIRWFREYLGEDPRAPLVHPSLPSSEHQSVLGIPIPGPSASMIVPGVGCVNGCSFCSTSHFFGRAYTPFIRTGKEMFELACRMADQRKTDVFFVMDENFLKEKNRAMELIEEMERHQRFFVFYTFSSAETIEAFGVENLMRLGVCLVWIGFESKSRQSLFVKNEGIDAKGLVSRLRSHGIAVLASGILCMEHHTPENIQADIDFLVGLKSDFVQFMLLTAMPVTALYKDFKKRGLLREELPFEEWHGQKMINWNHPAFSGDEPERWIKSAFDQDFKVNSSSLYRVSETAIRGYKTLAAMDARSANLEARMNQMVDRASEYGISLSVLARHPVNEDEKLRTEALESEMRQLFGPLSFADKIRRIAAHAFAAAWRLRLRLWGDMFQPKTIFTRYRARQLPRQAAEDAVDPAMDPKDLAEPAWIGVESQEEKRVARRTG